MKKKDLQEIKNLESSVLLTQIIKAQTELADLVFEKNMKKLKDIKTVFKKRKDISQMLTVFTQKKLLKELEDKK